MSLILPIPPVQEEQVAAAIRGALVSGGARIQQLDTPVGRLWLKRIERLSLRWRLQKGDPAKRFHLDLAGLHLLHDAGLPVAPIVAEGPDYYVTPDVGPTLRALLADPHLGAEERRRAFEAAGLALARLHASGFSHGRPALRDLCWNGQAVTFIDMERFSPRRRKARHLTTDLVVFVHSVLMDGGSGPDLDAALAAYRAAGGADTLRRAGRLGRRLVRFAPLAERIAARKPKARDLAAVGPALHYLAGLS